MQFDTINNRDTNDVYKVDVVTKKVTLLCHRPTVIERSLVDLGATFQLGENEMLAFSDSRVELTSTNGTANVCILRLTTDVVGYSDMWYCDAPNEYGYCSEILKLDDSPDFRKNPLFYKLYIPE